MKQHFHREDIEKIQAVLNKFPHAGSFELEIISESGIGTTGYMILPTTVNDLQGEFKIEIWGSENW
jgi:hypothetical protein